MDNPSVRNNHKCLFIAGRQVPINTTTITPNRAHKRVRRAITGDPNKRIRNYFKEDPQVRFLDKFSFTLGVLVITFTEFIILRRQIRLHPQTSCVVPNILYTVCLMPILFALRFVKFQALKYQWFMLDFCYLVNASCMLQTHCYPNPHECFLMNYAASVGPLAASTVIWKNSLVFHCLDKLTTFFVHGFPPLLCHLIRWDLIPSDGKISSESIQFWPFYTSALGLYVGWQISYLFVTEWMFRNTLNADSELCTSLRYLAADKKNPVTETVQRFVKSVGILRPNESFNAKDLRTKIVFVLTQLVYTLITLIPPYLVFQSHTLCVTYLVSLFVWSTWNGASYYIEVFSKKYQMKFQDDDQNSLFMNSSVGYQSRIELPDGGEEVFLDRVGNSALHDTQALELLQLLQTLDDREKPPSPCLFKRSN